MKISLLGKVAESCAIFPGQQEVLQHSTQKKGGKLYMQRTMNCKHIVAALISWAHNALQNKQGEKNTQVQILKVFVSAVPVW